MSVLSKFLVPFCTNIIVTFCDCFIFSRIIATPIFLTLHLRGSDHTNFVNSDISTSMWVAGITFAFTYVIAPPGRIVVHVYKSFFTENGYDYGVMSFLSYNLTIVLIGFAYGTIIAIPVFVTLKVRNSDFNIDKSDISTSMFVAGATGALTTFILLSINYRYDLWLVFVKKWPFSAFSMTVINQSSTQAAEQMIKEDDNKELII